MIVLHTMPAVTWSGPVFLTSSARLNDSSVTSACRIEFAGGSLTDYVAPTATWTTPVVIRGAMIVFDYGVPAGVKVEMRGRRLADAGYTYALGGNALTQRTIERPDGSVAITCVFDEGLDPIVGLEIRIFDDANGVTYVDGYIDVGEVFFGEGDDVCIQPNVGMPVIDPTVYETTIGNQPFVVERKEALTLTVNISPVSFETAFTAEASLQRLRARLARKKDCVVIFTVRTPHTGSVIDYDVVQAVAMFGKCTDVGELQSFQDGKHWVLPLTFRETPGRLVD